MADAYQDGHDDGYEEGQDSMSERVDNLEVALAKEEKEVERLQNIITEAWNQM